ncbi:MAG TPA: phage tail protein, partial [Polyangiaceae bacterium]|nr:phage tail protein [Polyangiaceae bacterium]
MSGDRLYPLLPAWYRGQDAAAGLDEAGRAPIEAWLAQIEASFSALHRATGQTYDDWFVETCSPALLPALGGLVGLELEGRGLPGDRRLVGNAIQRWRRKGSLWALRDALEAASSWPVEIGEFENELVVTEATGYRRTPAEQRRTTPALRANRAGPSLRRIEVRVRRGFGVVVENAEPFAIGDGWYGFDASGLPQPVRADRVGVRVAGRELTLARPAPELEQEWQRSPEHPPAGDQAVLDAPRGRFWLPPALRECVRVDWVSVRPGPIGAGLPDAGLAPPPSAWRAVVSKDFTNAELGRGRFRSIGEALEAWPVTQDADVRLLDSGSYPALDVPSRPGRTLTLHAHPGELPCLASLRSSGALRLSGVLVAGDVTLSGASAELCAASIRGQLSLAGGRIVRSLVGSIEVTAASELELQDSIVGARSSIEAETPTSTLGSGGSLSGPDVDGIVLRAERTTFLGWVR